MTPGSNITSIQTGTNLSLQKSQANTWLHTKPRRKIKKKENVQYNQKFKNKEDWKHYNTYKKGTRKALRSTQWKYINRILLTGLNENNTKLFWKYVKSTRQENLGVASLQKYGELKRDRNYKVEILNDQFKSVFTSNILND